MLAGIGPRVISIDCDVDGFMSSSTQLVLKPIPVKIALLIDADEADAHVSGERTGSGRMERAARGEQSNGAGAGGRHTHFDLILTSEKTSGKDDIELLRKLRMARPHTCLIILTDESAPSYVIDSMTRARVQLFFETIFAGRAGGNGAAGDGSALLGRWDRGDIRDAGMDSVERCAATGRRPTG